MTGHACRNRARRIASPIQLLARLPVGGVGFQPRIRQAGEIGTEIGHVVRAQGRRIRRHHGIGTLAVLEVFQLFRNVVRAEAREARPFGVRAIAVGAMTSPANDGLGGAVFDAACGHGRVADERTGNCCCENPKPLHDRLLPHVM